jgi:glycosyltransferase involved in cell wall biosynthesis
MSTENTEIPGRISVIIPAYNASRFIERTIDSVLHQTIKDFELIVIDDGSTDNTRSLAEAAALRDPRIQLITVRNGGVAKARNIGIEAAKGEFVAFLDADDVWHPQKLERQLAALRAEPKAAACYVLHRRIDQLDMVDGNQESISVSGYTFAFHFYKRPVGNGSALLVKRTVAVEVGGFDSSWANRGIGGCEDFDFEMKIVSRYPIVCVNLYLLGYRTYPGNMSSNKFAMGKGLVATVDQHAQIHPELPSWLVKKVRASALEYALSNYLSARIWKEMPAAFARLFRVDFTRGISLLFHFATRKLIRSAKRVVKANQNQTITVGFDRFNPDDNLRVSKLSSREKEITDRIQKLDIHLASMFTSSAS